MLLAIDVGNTNTVLGVFRLNRDGSADKLVADWRISTAREQTADEYGGILRNLFALRELNAHDVSHIVIASVVPPLQGTLRRVCEQYFGVKALFVEPGIKTGMPVLVDNPNELGADRLVDAIAAYERIGGPCIVVDMGTATTFDVVSKNGEYIGGVIAPGLGISADALFARTARLPKVDIRKPARVIGTNTIAAVQSGFYFGYAGLIDGIIDRLLEELGTPARVIATGGLADLMVGASRHIREVDGMLTLEGLRIVYERNRQTRRPAAEKAH
jgi:type III pantothenate kinase